MPARSCAVHRGFDHRGNRCPTAWPVPGLTLRRRHGILGAARGRSYQRHQSHTGQGPQGPDPHESELHESELDESELERKITMYLEETPEQQALRAELRAYFADILTEDVRYALDFEPEGG